MSDDLTLENDDVQIAMDYVRLFDESRADVPSYMYCAAVTHRAVEIFSKTHPDVAVFCEILDNQIPITDTEVSPAIKWRPVVAALSHPDCPPEYLVAALKGLVMQYREAAFANPSTPEDAKIAYWLTRGSAS